MLTTSKPRRLLNICGRLYTLPGAAVAVAACFYADACVNKSPLMCALCCLPTTGGSLLHRNIQNACVFVDFSSSQPCKVDAPIKRDQHYAICFAENKIKWIFLLKIGEHVARESLLSISIVKQTEEVNSKPIFRTQLIFLSLFFAFALHFLLIPHSPYLNTYLLLHSITASMWDWVGK